ncbi:MAG: response regulator transcription factor [Oscillospiraceae bacterium]|nr:response regulator transcription factor [Oscillospiraceae bacterium]
MPLIYCVEDDDGIRELITCVLRSGSYETEVFDCAAPFNEAVKKRVPDLILLDIMLPDEDGFSILRRLKADKTTADVPVIMLTAKTAELDKVNGLESGADDYICKPFGVMELLSRIKAVLRRTGRKSAVSDSVLEIDGLSLDNEKRIVTYNGTEVTLTYKEFELLACLMRNKGIVLTREKLMEQVWGFDFEGETRTVDVHVKTLRQKLELAGCSGLIRTVRSVGYKIN